MPGSPLLLLTVLMSDTTRTDTGNTTCYQDTELSVPTNFCMYEGQMLYFMFILCLCGGQPHLLPPAPAAGCTWARSRTPEPPGWPWWCWPLDPDAASPPPAAGSSGCARPAGGSVTPPAPRRISGRKASVEGGSNGIDVERQTEWGNAQINWQFESFGETCVHSYSRLYIRGAFSNVKWLDNTLIQ